MTKHILIDCDPGIDDSLALIYGLKNTSFNIEAITTVFGNTSAKQAGDNALAIINLINPKLNIPVSIGQEENLSCDPVTYPIKVHGSNGLGELELEQGLKSAIDKPAWQVIIDKANELEGELIIISLAKMTNIALALEKDRNLAKKVKAIYAMGGALKVSGNIRPYAEANVYGDIEAFARVLKAGFNLYLFSLDVTNYMTLDLERFKKESSLQERKVFDMLDYLVKFFESIDRFRGQCLIHDILPLLVLDKPELAKFEKIKLGVSNIGQLIEGKYEVNFCRQINVDKVLDKLHKL